MNLLTLLSDVIGALALFALCVLAFWLAYGHGLTPDLLEPVIPAAGPAR